MKTPDKKRMSARIQKRNSLSTETQQKQENTRKAGKRTKEKVEIPPQHVSSSEKSSSSSEPEGSDDEAMISQLGEHRSLVENDSPIEIVTEEPSKGYSRLFSPYRTLGVVAEGPFHLLPNQNSSSAVVCAAIGERFHMLKCDKLQPVLVSHAVPGPPAAKGDELVPQNVQHIISDNSLSLSVAAHGPRGNPRQLTLFQRTQPIGTVSITNSSNWTIVDLLHIGRLKVAMSGEKEGKKENAILCAAILSKGAPLPNDEVPLVGDDDDSIGSSGSDSSKETSSSSENEGDDYGGSRGQVVLLVATRTSFYEHKRIDLSAVPTFCPKVAVHPPTYVNKIVLGGSCAKTGKAFMILLNVRSGNVIYTFKSILNKHQGKSEISSLEASPALDTLAVGTSKGFVHLVNIRKDVLLFSLEHTSSNGKPAKITSLAFRTDGSTMQYGIAPLAVGRADGTITVWDLTPPEHAGAGNFGEEAPSIRTRLCEMERVHYPGGVHKIQYLPQEPLLLSTGTHSNSILMHIFDNPDHSGRILRQRKGHTAPPKFIRYLHPGAGAGGGVLVNASDGTDAAACQILSGGSTDRTLRIFSTVRSVLDKEYSQGRGLEKRARQLRMSSKAELLLPPVTCTASCETRTRDWGDLVTIHKDHAFAYVWSSKRGAQSGPVLRQDEWNVSSMKRAPPASEHATAVALSACGNFALVGTRGGRIYKYNIESGNVRGAFPPGERKKDGKGREAGDIRRTFKALEKTMRVSNRASNLDREHDDKVVMAKREQKRVTKLQLATHVGYAVTGIAVDGVNKTVISVGEDSKLILWNFKTHAPHKRCPITLPAPATKLSHVRDSDLAAIALVDYSVLLFDCSSLTTVRRFGYGSNRARHTGPISDLGFSPDGRTLYSASKDGTIRVWDVPTNSCVDWLAFATPPTALTVSPTGEFLATTHVGRLGISLWSDRSFYQTVHVDGARPIEAPASMDDPSPIAEIDVQEDSDNAMKRVIAVEERKEEVDVADEAQVSNIPAKAKEEGLITMSGMPPAHWKNLFHLELVKQRNKPKEAPKKPPSAPFFLQWRPGQTLEGEPKSLPANSEAEKRKDDDEWDAVWSDDDTGLPIDVQDGSTKRKKRKVSHFRSHLAALLEECGEDGGGNYDSFQRVTDHIGTLGPSAIDVSLSTLCSGMHDLEEGLPLLILACRWLTEACQSRERFEAINAYLHRFLHLHSEVLAGIKEIQSSTSDALTFDESNQEEKEQAQRDELLSLMNDLRGAQRASSEYLHGKMQNTLCLLRHFSRMV